MSPGKDFWSKNCFAMRTCSFAFSSGLPIKHLGSAGLTTHVHPRPRRINQVGQSSRQRLLPQAVVKSEEKVGNVRLICCDVDGTLLDSSHNISQKNMDTVIELIKRDEVKFVPATGKSRAGALNAMKDVGELLLEKHNGQVPGVYLQGQIVHGMNGVVYERTIAEDMARRIVQHADEMGVTLVAFSGDTPLATDMNHRTESLCTYFEPRPHYIDTWDSVIGEAPLHKFLYMDDPEKIDQFRPVVERMTGSDATVTQACAEMLEVLPPGASKGLGVTHLLKDFNIHPDNVMGIGDAENDLEMLKLVGFGCAVNNASPLVKSAAKYVVASNHDGGVSEAIEKFVFFRDGGCEAEV